MLLIAGLCGALGLVARERGPEEANAEPTPFSLPLLGQADKLRAELESAQGELNLANAQLEKWQKIFVYSSTYRIPADLAGTIIDISLAEGIDPDLAFRLVRLESEFNERATSPVGAIGLTQLMLPTARYFEKDVTRERLYERELNLRIGFRYLRTLIREQRGNVQMALLVYNRGPAAVTASKEMGRDPSNGYDRIVMKGYSGKGVID